MNILFTCAGRRNYLIRYFKVAIGDSGKIYAADMQLSAPALVDADKAFKVPSIYDEDYIRTLYDICKKENIISIISLNDLELPILASNKKLFEEIGVKLIVSSEEVIKITFDKYETIRFATLLGIPTPKTFLSQKEAISAINNNGISFPLIIKPRWGSASIGIEIVNDLEELELAYQLQIKKLKRTILFEASKQDLDNAILIQEMIKGQEFGVDIINDLSCKYQATIVKKKLAMRAGETDKAITVDNIELKQLGELIGNNLGHIGNLDCDFFYDNGKYYLLEMNSRFGGGYPFSHEAGANVPMAIIKWLKNEEIDLNLFSVKNGEAFSKFDNLMSIPTEDE